MKHLGLSFYSRLIKWINKLSNIQIQYCTHLLYFIFHFHHEDGKEGKKFALWKVCLPTRNGQRLENYHSTCPPYTSWRIWRTGEGKLPKSHQNLHLMFKRFLPAIFCWPEGENSSFLLLLMMKLRSDTKPNLHSSVQIIFLYFSIQQMWENNTQC